MIADGGQDRARGTRAFTPVFDGLCPPSTVSQTILPTLIWGVLSQASWRPGVGFEGSAQRRRAEPYAAQRAAAVGRRKDWLPAIAAATHCITSYPVGPPGPVPTFRMLAARKPRG